MAPFEPLNETGLFWLPELGEDDAATGTLRVDPRSFPEVETLGTLDPSDNNGLERHEYNSVHGLLSSATAVTLFGATDTRRSITMAGPLRQVRADFAVTGSVVDPSDPADPRFTWAAFGGPMLNAVYGFSSLELDRHDASFDLPPEWSIHTREAPKLVADIVGRGTVTLDTVPRYQSNGDFSAEVSQQTWFEIRPHEPEGITFTELVNDYVVPLSALVDFCTGTSFRFNSGYCKMVGQTEDRAVLRLHSAAFDVAAEATAEHERRVVFADPGVDFEKVLRRWMPMQAAASRAFTEVSRNEVRRDTYGVVDTFVALSGAMEAMHRTSALKSTRMSAGEASKLRARARDGLAAGEVRVVNEALARVADKTLKTRLEELVELVGDALADDASELEAELGRIVAVRNELVHHTKRKKVDYVQMVRHNRLLRRLFVGVACHNLGLPAQRVGDAVHSVRVGPRHWPPDALPKL